MLKKTDILYVEKVTPTGVVTLCLDIYLPKALTRRTVIVYAHGGGFRIGGRDGEDVHQLADRFTAYGFGFVAIDYRLSSGPDSFPIEKRQLIAQRMKRSAKRGVLVSPKLYGYAFSAAVEDGSDAIGFLRRNGPRLGLPQGPIGFVGASAGAIMGLSLAYPNSVDAEQTCVPDRVLSIAGTMVQPWCLRADGPPVLMFHGQRDRIINIQNARNTLRRAKNIGAAFEAELSPQTHHQNQLNHVLNGTSLDGRNNFDRVLEFFAD